MKVNKAMFAPIPYSVPLGDQLEDETVVELSDSSVSLEFLTQKFMFIDPGEERLFCILLSDGYDTSEIAWMAGKTKAHVSKVIKTVRVKLQKNGIHP